MYLKISFVTMVQFGNKILTSKCNINTLQLKLKYVDLLYIYFNKCTLNHSKLIKKNLFKVKL